MNAIAKRRLSPAECHALLEQQLPHWSLQSSDQGTWIQREYQTRSWAMTLHAAHTVGFLAEVGWHHPRLVLEYNALKVELYSHDVGGITMRDMELALRIEDVLTWIPGADDALPGHARRRVA